MRPFYNSDLVKVITGIRRCGKSAVLNQVMSEIKKESNNIIYLNFEKTSDLLKVNNSAGLIKYINENKKDGKCYIFLDEIQEVDNWQIAVKDLRLDNNSIFITGSNSKLLSREILSLLSGRFINIQIRPFIYNEIVQLLEESKKEATITDYLIWGGFPGRFQYESLDAQKDYLFDLMGTIVYNDLMKRYKIKKEVVFRKIVQFILRSNSRIISSRNIQKHIKNECESISLNTVLKYIEYLKEAYIIDEIPQYSSKTKKELSYYYKVYDEDVCFNSLNVIDGRYDLEHNLENIVYNELIYRGYKINVFNNGTKEIDFYAIKNGKEYFIQVAYSLVNEKTYEREFSAFKNLDYSVNKIIISMDDVDYSTSLVKHISLKNFLKANDFE
ncbi:MAG TPA: hypothetical protein DDW20_01745 [Firmicutes bacterium]|nr:hypothetical protein [Bacillota bacterium]